MSARSTARQRRRSTVHTRGHSLGLAVLRGVVGGLFIGHGSQKLFGSFGGHGLAATASGFEQMGLRPGRQMATAAGASELVGGSLLALGASTPLASAMLSGTMATAIEKVHRRNGVWVTNGGFEYNVVMMAAVFALADTGPGRLSLDHLRGRERRGVHWALAQLAAGLAGSAAVAALASRNAPEQVGTEVSGPTQAAEPTQSDQPDSSPEAATPEEVGTSSENGSGSA